MAGASKLAARPLVAVALAMAALCVAGATTEAQRGGSLRVAIGEVGASDGDPGTVRAFSQVLSETLAAQPLVDVTPAQRAQIVLRGSVVRWDRRPVEDGLEVRCEVSLVVADARGGSIRAMLTGRGGARGAGDPARLSADALRAAVRGALRPLASQGTALARAR
jgi:hypothetical protein